MLRRLILLRPVDFPSGVPLTARPPELQFDGNPLELVADIWTLAYVLYAILSNGSLLEGSMRDPEDIIAENTSVTGWVRYECYGKNWFGIGR